MFGKGDAGIEFKADQKDERIEVHPDHHHDNSSDRAVQFIVGIEVVDIVDKARKGQDCQNSCKASTWAEEFPSLRYRRAVFVQHAHHEEIKGKQDDPASGFDGKCPKPREVVSNLFLEVRNDHAGDRKDRNAGG